MSEITMSDGLTLAAREIASAGCSIEASIWEVTSISGGEAGWVGYGATISDAVADLYRAKGRQR